MGTNLLITIEYLKMNKKKSYLIVVPDDIAEMLKDIRVTALIVRLLREHFKL